MAILRVRDNEGKIIEIPLNGGSVAANVTCYCSLPEYVHVKIGNEFKAYFRNFISLKSAYFWIGTNNNLTTKYYDDCFSIVANAEGSHDLNWKVYDENSNLLESGTLTIIATAKSATGTTTAMLIGDSTVNAGVITQKALDLYTADGATLNLLGTRGTAPNLHEGRGGWTAYAYCKRASDSSYQNPFYNNGAFDFANYMATQGYSDLGVVGIQLGINDIFPRNDENYQSETALTYLSQMVNSILAYDSNIKIVINLPTTPNSNNISFTDTYGTSQLYWVFNRNIIRFAEELRDYFKDNTNVIISASNCVLDTKTDIRDGVHPTNDGYNKLGQRFYEVLISITDGVTAGILEIGNRELVITKGTTISATSARKLELDKCYVTSFSGTRSAGMANCVYSSVDGNGVSFTATNASAGWGVEFPVELEVGKNYKLSYNANIKNARVYLLKYNTDTTYNSNALLTSAAGNHSVTITPEEGLIYTIMFSAVTADECTWTNISLTQE